MFSKNTVFFIKVAILLLVSFLSMPVVAQHSVLGTVFEGETNRPVHGASVFIDNTTRHVSTGRDGSFMITKLDTLHYNLVISRAGYETQVVDVLPGEPLAYKIILKPKEKLDRAVVPKSRIEEITELNLFKDHFIGRSENHRQCTIENPGTLSFERNGDKLMAFADSAVWIENRGLGYRLKVLIEFFKYDTTSLNTDYRGHVYYELLTPKDDREAKRWSKNRLNAYHGSVTHFLRAFHNRKLNEEGFYFNLFTDINPGQWGGGFERTSYSDSVMTSPSPVYNNKPIKVSTITDYNIVIDSLSFPNEPMLDFGGGLSVTYIMEEEGYLYQQSRGIQVQRKPQRSEFILRRPAVIQRYGELYPTDAFKTQGYWNWELFAESLPLDYEPNAKLTPKK